NPATARGASTTTTLEPKPMASAGPQHLPRASRAPLLWRRTARISSESSSPSKTLLAASLFSWIALPDAVSISPTELATAYHREWVTGSATSDPSAAELASFLSMYEQATTLIT